LLLSHSCALVLSNEFMHCYYLLILLLVHLAILSLVKLIDCLLLRLGCCVHSLFSLCLRGCLLLTLYRLLGGLMHYTSVADAIARLHWHDASICIIDSLLILLIA
jgi:hypothetical protein